MQPENTFIPESQIVARYSPNLIDGVLDEKEEILRAMSEPIGTERLALIRQSISVKRGKQLLW